MKRKKWFLNCKLASSSHWLDVQTWWEDLWQPVQRLHAFALRSHDAVTPSKSAIITSIMVMVYLCDLQSSFHYILPTKSSFWRTIDCRSSFLRSSFSFKSCRRCSCLVNVTSHHVRKQLKVERVRLKNHKINRRKWKWQTKRWWLQIENLTLEESLSCM